MGKKKIVKLSKKELKYRSKLFVLRAQNKQTTPSQATERVKKRVDVPKVVSIRKLAEASGLSPVLIIQSLFKNGIVVSINQSIDFDTAVLLGDELGLEITLAEGHFVPETKNAINGKKRPPVVTIMGHVDHGKTLLLDTIRNTDIIATESGGITQHIGAYQVVVDYENEKRKITFLDTPGHEAFSALRAHGANITDIVVLVVAANDGVKAQTLEAISHAKAAQVPIVVAINKIDLPDSDIEKIKGQLAEHKIVAEEWGGGIPFVEISAKKNRHIDKLLEIILLVADMKELKADFSSPAEGTVIESNVDSKTGITATLLVQTGTLRPKDILVAGESVGKIRSMKDWRGRKINLAPPSTPVVVTGLKSVPKLGDKFRVVEDEKSGKKFIGFQTVASADITADNGSKNEFKIIIKADTVGSLGAIKAALGDISEEKINIKILAEGVGAITETDINLAITSHSHIFGFRTEASQNVKSQAKRQEVDIKFYDTIYKLIDDLYLLIESEIKPEITEDIVAKIEILKVFFQSGDRAILGGRVIDGEISKGLKILFKENDRVVGAGKIVSLKIGPLDVDKVEKNGECGIEVSKKTPPAYKIRANETAEIVRLNTEVVKLTKKQNISK